MEGHRVARQHLAETRDELAGVSKEALMQQLHNLKLEMAKREAERKILNTRCLRAEAMMKQKDKDQQRW
jgi:hypothetical protein